MMTMIARCECLSSFYLFFVRGRRCAWTVSNARLRRLSMLVFAACHGSGIRRSRKSNVVQDLSSIMMRRLEKRLMMVMTMMMVVMMMVMMP